MFADRSVRGRWPLFAADYAELFRGLAWGIRDTKGLFGESRNRVEESRCLSGRVMMMTSNPACLCCTTCKPITGHEQTDAAAVAGARSPTTDTLISFAYPNILPCRSAENYVQHYCIVTAIYIHAHFTVYTQYTTIAAMHISNRVHVHLTPHSEFAISIDRSTD